MAVRQYQKEGKTLYKVSVVQKSSLNPYIVSRKQKKGITNKSVAENIESKLRIEALKEVSRRETESIKWGKLVSKWRRAVATKDIFVRNINDGTADDYLSVLNKYTSDWFEVPTTEIDQSKCWKLLAEVETQVSIARSKRLRTAIDAVFDWAISSGELKGIQAKPTQGFKCVTRAVEKRPEILTLSQTRQFLLAAKAINHPWYPAWAFASLTGMRSGELYALEWEDIDFDSGQILVSKNWTSKSGFGPTKGRYWRKVPINSELRNLLMELKNGITGGSKFVLPRFNSWKDGRQAEVLKTFLKGCGLPPVKFHNLRACFATLLIQEGVAPAIVMSMCGWKDLKTMQRYIRLAGVNIGGMTDGLKILPPEEAAEKVVKIISNQ